MALLWQGCVAESIKSIWLGQCCTRAKHQNSRKLGSYETRGAMGGEREGETERERGEREEINSMFKYFTQNI